MKRMASLMLAFAVLVSALFFGRMTLAQAETADESGAETVPKVIVDTDIAFPSDDAIAVFMLAQAERAGELELLGVCTVGGNVFSAVATATALRLLELIDRTDIPVYEGTDVPLAGFRDMEEEGKEYGIPDFCGAYWDFQADDFSNPYARPTDYRDLGYEPRFGYAETQAQPQNASDFMIEQVHRYPGEITIMSIGAATNVATAIQKDPEFAADAAGIIYMGGDIDVSGNATAAAELNWFYDPDAIKICLSEEWKSQLVVPDDLARQVCMDSSVSDRLKEKGNNEITKLVLLGEEENNLYTTRYVWDVLVPAVFLRPEIMEDVQVRYLTVDDQPGLNYGRAVSWKQNRHNNPETGEGMPADVQPVPILMGIDEAAFWDLYVDLLTG